MYLFFTFFVFVESLAGWSRTRLFQIYWMRCKTLEINVWIQILFESHVVDYTFIPRLFNSPMMASTSSITTSSSSSGSSHSSRRLVNSPIMKELETTFGKKDEFLTKHLQLHRACVWVKASTVTGRHIDTVVPCVA